MKYFLCLVVLLVSIPAVAAQNNQSAEDIVVVLNVAGFYSELEQ
ncbi:MAG: hypothetical protein ACO4AC_09070 [Pseudohongiellaceae bacterium]|jgi:putative cell wall-binding protein